MSGPALPSSSTHGSMSRSKCVNACRRTGSRRACSVLVPKIEITQARTESASGNSGGAQSPPQMPRGGRRCSRTRPLCSANTICVCLRRRAVRRRRRGNSATRSIENAPQPPTNGQRSQAGLARVHTVAPRSMIACVNSATRVSGVQASARSHSARVAAAVPGASSTTNTRASTRFTLPSRIAWRCPRASASIAPAVERPIPGNAVNASNDSGKQPS